VIPPSPTGAGAVVGGVAGTEKRTGAFLSSTLGLISSFLQDDTNAATAKLDITINRFIAFTLLQTNL